MNKDSYKDETISAFAFFTGKEIERIINENSDNLVNTNKLLEGLILSFRHKLFNTKEEFFNPSELLVEFDKHFNINSNREGKI